MSRKPAGPVTWLAKYLSLAATLPASLIAGYLLGSAADHWLRSPILRVIGILLGLLGGILQIVRELNRDQ